MSIKSTYIIKRDLALEIILSKTFACSNEQLSNILEEFEESHFRNYDVVDDLPELDKNNIQNDFIIKNINDF